MHNNNLRDGERGIVQFGGGCAQCGPDRLQRKPAEEMRREAKTRPPGATAPSTSRVASKPPKSLFSKKPLKETEELQKKSKTKEKIVITRVSPIVTLPRPKNKSSGVSSGQIGGSSGGRVLRRPLSEWSSSSTSGIIGRRGQVPKAEGQEDLSRASSVNNLNAEVKGGKGAKPRKSASRDKLDKIGEKKNEKKAITKNNNKFEAAENLAQIDSFQEIEQLQKQLQEMANEKSTLALELGEQKLQVVNLQREIEKLKSIEEKSNMHLEQLSEENTALKNRLRDVAHSPLSDNEKQQLLFETQRQHSSAPASITSNLLDENSGDITACPTPDWDKQSSGNLSEVSVACLQDKINQMQETHYSTNEELQATLQELTDLQKQLTELQQENERLTEEKTLMFDSLCRQTERLNDSRQEVEDLKQLLYRDKDDKVETAVEREQKLVVLLKSAQEERESLLLKLEQLSSELQDVRSSNIHKEDEIINLADRVRTLECTLDAKHAEHKQLDQELAQARDQCSGKQIEINRLKDLLENARTKINELEQDRALSDKSELDELLDNARKEKDGLESEVANLKEQVARSKNETEKLKEQLSILQEDCKVIRNNAKTIQSDLEYKLEKTVADKGALTEQLQQFQEAINELQVQSQCQLDDKRQLSAVLSETQRNLSEAESKNCELAKEIEELRRIRKEENDEWEKFQNDLLTSVRVANDFKTEAQQELQKFVLENKTHRERIRQLEAQIDKFKVGRFGEVSSASASSGNLLKSRKSGSKSSVSEKSYKEKDMFKRERKSKRRGKNLSVEEELLMKSLDTWYASIDPLIPEDQLNEEDRVVKKLKALYEDLNTGLKPVANKPKDQLAISKPLLDSVISNPQLRNITDDPSIPTVEDLYKQIRRNSKRIQRPKTDSPSTPKPALHKSKSLNDVNLHFYPEKPSLQRTNEIQDLTRLNERFSLILPTDSVSNLNYPLKKSRVKKEEDSSDSQVEVQKPIRKRKKKKNSVTFQTLDVILSSIPKNAQEATLSHEQRFALRLKKALNKAERKRSLKKVNLRSKQVKISSPTLDSVMRNPKLVDVLYSEDNLNVGPNKMRANSLDDIYGGVFSPIDRSRSCDNIHFSFVPQKGYEGDESDTSSMTSGCFDFNKGEVVGFDRALLEFLPGNRRFVEDGFEYIVETRPNSDQVSEEKDSLILNEDLEERKQYRRSKELRDSLNFEDVEDKDKKKKQEEMEVLKQQKYDNANKNELIDLKPKVEDGKEEIEVLKQQKIENAKENEVIDLEMKVEDGKDEIEVLKQQKCKNENEEIDLDLKVEDKKEEIELLKQHTFKNANEGKETHLEIKAEEGKEDIEILKQQKYGIPVHLPIRSTYRKVVAEFKQSSKFCCDFEDQSSEESETEDDDGFIDNFFKPVNLIQSVQIKELSNKNEDNFNIIDNNRCKLQSEDIAHNMESLTEEENSLVESVNSKAGPISYREEDLDLIGENIKRYIDEDETDASFRRSLKQKNKEDDLLPINLNDSVQSEEITLKEDSNKHNNLTFIYNKSKLQPEDIAHNMESLTEEERSLVESINSTARPPSYGEEDLELIEEIMKRYTDEDETDASFRRSLKQKDEDNGLFPVDLKDPILSEEIKLKEDTTKHNDNLTFIYNKHKLQNEDIAQNRESLTEEERSFVESINSKARPTPGEDPQLIGEIKKQSIDEDETEASLKQQDEDDLLNVGKLTYQPVFTKSSVYASLENRKVTRKKMEKEDKGNKSSENEEGSSSLKGNQSHAVNSRNSVKLDSSELNMGKTENYRESVEEKLLQETSNGQVKVLISESSLLASNIPTVFGGIERFYENNTLVHLEDHPKEFSNSIEEGKETGAIRRAKKFLGNMPLTFITSEDKMEEDDMEELACAVGIPDNAGSAIAVSGKYEQLDITKNILPSEESIEEINASNLNLFNMETNSINDSYLDLYKNQIEEVGSTSKRTTYFNDSYVGELSDESLSDKDKCSPPPSRLSFKEDPNDFFGGSKKIVDFVPLDESTNPVFQIDQSNAYEAMEHHLNPVPSRLNTSRNLETNSDVQGKRSSFNNARRMFEALVAESNLEKESEVRKGKIKNKDSKESQFRLSSYDLKEHFEVDTLGKH